VSRNRRRRRRGGRSNATVAHLDPDLCVGYWIGEA
jgi:hypothetical protein